MGAQKLLLPYAGKTVIAHIVDELLASKIERVLAVVGSDARAITSVLGDRKVVVVSNPDPNAEMLSSVRCGFAALPADCRGGLIALGDQPSITHAIVDQLVDAFDAGDHGIVVPFHNNRRGHPMIVSVRYRDEIMTLPDESGLRGLLDAHPEGVLKLPTSNPAVLGDMDYPEDYERELNSIQDQQKSR